jgi:hypothetical protein
MNFCLSETPEPLEKQDPKRTQGTGVPTHGLFDALQGKHRDHRGIGQ